MVLLMGKEWLFVSTEEGECWYGIQRKRKLCDQRRPAQVI